MSRDIISPKTPTIYTLILIGLGLAAYANGLTGEFIFDDAYIRDTPAVHHLARIGEVLFGTNRPVWQLSLAVNYALGGVRPFGYHLFNLLVHLAAAWTVFRLISGTLRQSPRLGWEPARALRMGFAAAVLWMLHPLQTGSVTYIIQRAESLMGLFYLLTMWATLRIITNQDSRRWQILGWTVCALGMATKEVMITAPLAALIYDRLFWSKTFRETFRQRGRFYLGLTATWIITALLLTLTQGHSQSVGFGLKTVTAGQYALTQPAVILHYLRLALWPYPLCLDYQWEPVASVVAAIPSLLGLGAIILGLLWAGRRWPSTRFLGIWFFLVLSVSSSFIPIQDLAFEHRMYLPLLSVILALLLAIEAVLIRYLSPDKRVRGFLLIVALIALGWGGMTFLRNRDYRDSVTMWQDILRQRPQNLRAYSDLGLALINAGRPDAALPYLRRALELNPNYIPLYNNIGLAMLHTGDLVQAQIFFQRAYQMRPDDAQTINNLALTYARQGQAQPAEELYRQATAVDPTLVDPYNNLCVLYLDSGRLDEAEPACRHAAKISPHYAPAYNNLGIIALYRNDLSSAQDYFERAIRLQPDYAKALNNLGVVLKARGEYDKARRYFRQALAIDPGYPEAQKNLQEIRDK